MTLTLELVEHIAELARLELTEDEKSRYLQQLSAILDYFEQLQTVDTEAISPTSGMQSEASTLRADEISASLDINEILSNAPDAKKRQFRVLPIFE
ncbi:MAG: Asp-tRNA(Asn)/Glu-tRNA(Gln) amidotransferase subunit GatC [Anaerolineales bacterium]|nr:Asp-tRNA(Asn)/Glu-tRNA(Gln) amidotransferase subunit GatC [Anaerolineales bacterium]